MTLRNGLVSTMAQAVKDGVDDWPEVDYPNGGGGLDVDLLAERVLDAALDHLSTNTEAWARKGSEHRMGQSAGRADIAWVGHLIAVLRDDQTTP